MTDTVGRPRLALFGPVSTLAQAEAMLKHAAWGSLALMLFDAMLGFRAGWAEGLAVIVLAMPAVALLAWKSRIAAVALLLISIFLLAGQFMAPGAGGPVRLFLSASLVLLAIRASEATFKRHRWLAVGTSEAAG